MDIQKSIFVWLVIAAAAACNAPGATESRDPSSGTAGAGGADPTATGDPAGAGATGTGGTPTSAGTGTGGGGGAGASYSGSDAARLGIRLVDAPTDEVTSIFVTVAKVDALLPTGWTTIVDQEQGVDLLTLQNGQFLALGVASLPPGRVGQLRLVLAAGGDHHVVTPDGVTHPLSVPSGEASGIKLVGGFDVPACGTGQVTMDFDGKRSLQVLTSGKNAGHWSMRPVIRLKSVATQGGCADGGAAADASPEPSVPPSDPCEGITCTDMETCVNGSCQTSM